MTSKDPQSPLQLNGSKGFIGKGLWLPTDDDFLNEKMGPKNDSSTLPYQAGNIGWFSP